MFVRQSIVRNIDLVSTVFIDGNDVSVQYECEHPAVWGPSEATRVGIGQSSRVAPIHIHDIDSIVAVPVGAKGNLRPIRRPGR